MRLKERYRIDDKTWVKLKGLYIKGFILGIPFVAVVFAFMTWAIADGFFWTPIVLIPCSVYYLIAICFCKLFFVRSKYTLLNLFLWAFLFDLLIAMLPSACCYRFFGIAGLLIQSVILLEAGVFVCLNGYSYWKKHWESHESYNENEVLDLVNGRYDLLNRFDMSEGKIKRKGKEKLSNPALSVLLPIVIPSSVGISLIFSKHGDYTTPIIIVWVLSFPFIFGMLKATMASFLCLKKISYYEKKIGKPIINGLLD